MRHFLSSGIYEVVIPAVQAVVECFRKKKAQKPSYLYVISSFVYEPKRVLFRLVRLGE